jgi:hypothetical protein
MQIDNGKQRGFQFTFTKPNVHPHKSALMQVHPVEPKLRTLFQDPYIKSCTTRILDLWFLS